MAVVKYAAAAVSPFCSPSSSAISARGAAKVTTMAVAAAAPPSLPVVRQFAAISRSYTRFNVVAGRFDVPCRPFQGAGGSRKKRRTDGDDDLRHPLQREVDGALEAALVDGRLPLDVCAAVRDALPPAATSESSDAADVHESLQRECPTLWGKLHRNDTDSDAVIDSEGCLRPDDSPNCFVLPRRSGVLLCDLRLPSALSTLPSHRFATIVVDPPWVSCALRASLCSVSMTSLSGWSQSSKSVARSRRYSTARSDDDARRLLSALPLRALLHDDGVVAVWVTNNPRLISLVVDELFPLWGVHHVRTGAWVKVCARACTSP